MAQTTAIEWCDVSWNPVHGCSIVSTECQHCYAAELSQRRRQTLKPWTPTNAAENVTLKPHKLREPLSNAKAWRGLGSAAAAAGKTDGMLVFVNSMSDLWHEQVPFKFIDEVFAVMAEAERHTFLILTKRPDRMLAYFERVADYMGLVVADLIPWPNIWLGVSIGLRHFVRRADVLRQTPAAVRFISAEPLLGPLVVPCGPRPDDWCCRTCGGGGSVPVYELDGGGGGRACDACEDASGTIPDLDLTGIDWLIAGGESGPHHRPMKLEWARDLRDACLSRGGRRPDGVYTPTRCDGASSTTAFFFKQHGGITPKSGGRVLDGRTWDEFPTDGTREGAPA